MSAGKAQAADDFIGEEFAWACGTGERLSGPLQDYSHIKY